MRQKVKLKSEKEFHFHSLKRSLSNILYFKMSILIKLKLKCLCLFAYSSMKVEIAFWNRSWNLSLMPDQLQQSRNYLSSKRKINRLSEHFSNRVSKHFKRTFLCWTSDVGIKKIIPWRKTLKQLNLLFRIDLHLML